MHGDFSFGIYAIDNPSLVFSEDCGHSSLVFRDEAFVKHKLVSGPVVVPTIGTEDTDM